MDDRIRIPLNLSKLIIPTDFPGESGVDYVICGGAAICQFMFQLTDSGLNKMKDIDCVILNHNEEYYNRVREFMRECDCTTPNRPSLEQQSEYRNDLNMNISSPHWHVPMDLICDTRYNSVSDIIGTFDLINSQVYISGNDIVFYYDAWRAWLTGNIIIRDMKDTTLDRAMKYWNKYRSMMLACTDMVQERFYSEYLGMVGE